MKEPQFAILIGKDYYGPFSSREEAVAFRNKVNPVADFVTIKLKPPVKSMTQEELLNQIAALIQKYEEANDDIVIGCYWEGPNGGVHEYSDGDFKLWHPDHVIQKVVKSKWID